MHPGLKTGDTTQESLTNESSIHTHLIDKDRYIYVLEGFKGRENELDHSQRSLGFSSAETADSGFQGKGNSMKESKTKQN